MNDLLMVRAPKPALMITTTRDMFSIQGSAEAAAEVSAIYAAYGKQEDFMMVTDDAPHASTQKNREALYAFLQKHLHQPGAPQDEEVLPLSAQELQVTPTGQVHTSMKGENIFSLNLKAAQKKHEALLAARKQMPAFFPAMLDSAAKLSGYRAPGKDKAPVFTGRLQRDGYVIEKYFASGEGSYVIPYLLMKPDNAGTKAILWLSPAGKAADAAVGGEMERLVKNGFNVLAPDLIGTGETGPGKFIGDSYIDSISYNLWFASVQTGRSITGIRAGDVVRLAQWLGKTGISEVYGIALNGMAPVLLHAAAFDKSITRVALLQPCISWHSIVSGRIYQSRFVQGAVAGAAGVYDLPDLAASLAPRKLLIAGAVNGNGEPVAGGTQDQALIEAAYRHEEGRLKTVPAGDAQDALAWWLKD